MKRLFKTAMFLLALSLMPALPLAASSSPTDGDGSFTVASMNVDGLPATVLGFISINPDGPGEDGSAEIGGRFAASGWDIIAVSEDFNFHDALYSGDFKANYGSGTHRGRVGDSLMIPYDTDGLGLFYKNEIAVRGEGWIRWDDYYPKSGTGNGGDSLIKKGFRFYTATVADGVDIDVYILHMDADSSAEDIDARESQLSQLADYIKSTDSKNPIIIMGDTNCRYTREHLQSLLIDSINEDPRFTAGDAWIENIRRGAYPAVGDPPIMASDKTGDGSGYPYPRAEIVDKIFFVNNADSDIHLRLDLYTVDTSFRDAGGAPLADHWPVTARFAYAKKYEVTYEDGVGGSVFESRTIASLSGDPTPGYGDDTPSRDGYEFVGWSPDVAPTVAGNATYTAVWRAVPESLVTEPPVSGTEGTDPGGPAVTEPGATAPGSAESSAEDSASVPSGTATDTVGHGAEETLSDANPDGNNGNNDNNASFIAPIIAAAAAVAAAIAVCIRRKKL